MKQITPQALKERMDKAEKIYLLDVREDHEHAEFNIGGVHHKLGFIQTMNIDPIEDWKEEEVVVYCRSGVRSGQAALILETLGFQNVYNLSGGMLAWQEAFKK